MRQADPAASGKTIASKSKAREIAWVEHRIGELVRGRHHRGGFGRRGGCSDVPRQATPEGAPPPQCRSSSGPGRRSVVLVIFCPNDICATCPGIAVFRIELPARRELVFKTHGVAIFATVRVRSEAPGVSDVDLVPEISPRFKFGSGQPALLTCFD